MVGLQALDLSIEVRILTPQPFCHVWPIGHDEKNDVLLRRQNGNDAVFYY
jgi:hypothetical protein